MKRFSLIILTGIIGLSVSCNTVQDEQITPPSNVPESAVQAVRDKFPNATNITFQTLQANRLWQATFTNQARSVRSAVTPAEMLVAYLPTGTVPDSIQAFVDRSGLTGGTFISDYKQRYSWQKGSLAANFFTADYRWQNRVFTIGFSEFSITNTSTGIKQFYNSIYLNEPNLMSFSTSDPTQLPTTIQQYLRERGLVVIEATPYSGSPISVSVRSEGETRYYVSSRQAQTTNGVSNGFMLVFDEAGLYLYADKEPNIYTSADKLPTYIRRSSNRADVPTAILTAIDSAPEYRNTTFKEVNRYELYGKVTFVVSLDRIGGGSWELVFDAQGEVLDREFFTFVY